MPIPPFLSKAAPLLWLAALPPMATAADDSLLSVYESMSVEVDSSDYVIHDPSRIITVGNTQMIAVTGKAQEDGYDCGLETWWRNPQTDGGGWRPGQCLFRKQNKPSWVAVEAPANDGAFWAPELDYDEENGTLTLLYSVSEMDEGEFFPNTCVGVAVSVDGLQGFPNELTWEDAGKPVMCITGSDYEEERSAIDPSVFWGFGDDENRLFLVTGGGRIIGTELDPATYMQKDGEWFDLDRDDWTELSTGPRREDDTWVEAAFVHPNPQTGHYYLFVNWGSCCSGVDSTYEIRVGRSRNPMGPYVDKKGQPMMEGGGTLFQKSSKRGFVVGPGHTGIWKKNHKKEFVSFHYYDKRRGGAAWIAEKRLRWKRNGWPKAVGRYLRAYPWNSDY